MLNHLCNFEQEEALKAQGLDCIAGVDEAGRGCLAGPVVAAAVVLPEDFMRRFPNMGLTDSKKLTAKRRQALAEMLSSEPTIQLGIGLASATEIDQLNILRATHLAMKRALQALPVAAEFALVDGLPVQGLPVEHQALVKGDSRSLSIAAASVIAKTHRDALMGKLDEQFPGYGFAQHKGYGTKAHLQALKENGPIAAHRQSFGPVRALSTA